MAPKLSICIPSRNRIHYLKQMLPSILLQADEFGVQVCVSDNNSTDGTDSFLAKLQVKHPCLKVIRQRQSLSLDENMYAVIQLADGDYVFPIGDDDCLPDESLVDLLEELNEETDLLILNAVHTGPNLERRKENLSSELKGKEFNSPSFAFISIWDKMHFGSFLAKREHFSEKYFKRYFGSSHAYAGVIWDCLAANVEKGKTCNIKCMEKQSILLRGGEKTWQDNASEVLLYEIPLWFRLLPEYYKNSYSKLLNNYLKSSYKFKKLIKYKSKNELSLQLIEKIYSLDLDFPIKQKIILAIVVKIPIAVAKQIVFVLDFLKSKK